MPTSVETVVATSVSRTLPASDGQNVGAARMRANAVPPPAKASTATPATGSAKKSASQSAAGAARTANQRRCMPRPGC